MTLDEMIQIKKEKGYSIAQIADSTKLPMGTLQKIFSGTTKSPRYETRQSLEAFFNHKLQSKGEYTIEDYYALPDDQRAELIDGDLYNMGAPSVNHQAIAGEVYFQLKSQLRNGKGCIPFIAPLDVQLDCDDKTMVQPDVFILCDQSKREDQKIMGAPDFILEVISPGTSRKDYTIKLGKYIEAGVKEYWIIDSDRKKLIVYDAKEEGIPEVHELTGILGLHLYDGKITIDLDAVAREIIW